MLLVEILFLSTAQAERAETLIGCCHRVWDGWTARSGSHHSGMIAPQMSDKSSCKGWEILSLVLSVIGGLMCVLICESELG